MADDQQVDLGVPRHLDQDVGGLAIAQHSLDPLVWKPERLLEILEHAIGDESLILPKAARNGLADEEKDKLPGGSD